MAAVFALPSLAAIVVTYAVLRFRQRRDARRRIAEPTRRQGSSAGASSRFGLAATAPALLVGVRARRRSGRADPLAGVATTLLVLALRRANPLAAAARHYWGVLPLVAGLFVLVQALDAAGVNRALARLAASAARRRSHNGGGGGRRASR